METPVLIIAAVLFVLGMLVRKYPNLIAGYNTMTAEQKRMWMSKDCLTSCVARFA
jgi:hypothetical protein